MCSECPPLLPVKSPDVSPKQNIFFTKFKMAANLHVKAVIPELCDIYFNVIPHSHLIFNAEYISETIRNF